MGIFDDAIREHLDLKRRQGVDENELQQLEDEAFGPPARPGEPDFPTGEEPAEPPAAEPDAAETEKAGAAEPDAAEPEEASALFDRAEAEPAPQDPPLDTGARQTAPEERDEPHVEPEDDAPPHGDQLLEHEADEDQADAEAGAEEAAGQSSFTTTERAAIAEQPTEFFDEAPASFELDDLDLDLADEDDEAAVHADELPPAESEPPAEEQQVVEEAEGATEEAEVVEPEPAAAAPASAERTQPEPELEAPDGEGESAAAASDGEDVLEETPEFLRDNPDDDELWFEQGKPKDFDF